MLFKKIVKMFENGNVSVSGMRGTGKDMLFANVVARRPGLDYVSNVNYGGLFNPFKSSDFNTNNDWHSLTTNDVKRYKFPYPDKTDLYLSDCGIYFPSQDCNQLVKQFSGLVTFSALSRHLGLCNVHTNSQYLGRVWDKLREQSNTYIVCQDCKVILNKIVVQRVRIYEKYASAECNIPPFRVKARLGIFGRSDRQQNYDIARTNYLNQYGKVKECVLVYRNRGHYDTRYFRELLNNGKE